MDIKEKILDSLTKDDIIELMTSFGVGHKKINGEIVFQSHCHGSEKYKLYYYEHDNDGRTHNEKGESCKNFQCYNSCGGMSVFNAFMEINNWSFGEAFGYLANFKGISTTMKRERKFGTLKQVIGDWEFINRYKRLDKARGKKSLRKLPDFNPLVLNVFDNIYPSTWEDEGITLDAMRKFGIKFDVINWKAILPHYDVWGRLIGIRGRAFLEQDLDEGKKYMPSYIENESYRHPLSNNLYGFYENLDTIKRLKKAFILEGEKSVLLCESYFPNNNFSVAICGTNMSNYQRDLLLYEGEIEEIIVGLDKQFQTELKTEKEMKEYTKYLDKVTKIAEKFINYCNVSIVYCDDDRLEYKDAPCDQGKDVLLQLMKEKERYYTEEGE